MSMTYEEYVASIVRKTTDQVVGNVAGFFLNWARSVVTTDGVDALTAERMLTDLKIPQTGAGLPSGKATPKSSTHVHATNPCKWIFANRGEACGKEQWQHPETQETYGYCYNCMLKMTVTKDLGSAHPGVDFVKKYKPGRKSTAVSKSTAVRPPSRVSTQTRSAPRLDTNKFHPSIRNFRYTREGHVVVALKAPSKVVWVLGTWEPSSGTLKNEVSEAELEVLKEHEIKTEKDEPEEIANLREELSKELERVGGDDDDGPSMPNSFDGPRSGFRRRVPRAEDAEEAEEPSERTRRYQRRSTAAEDQDGEVDVPRTRGRVPRRRVTLDEE